MSDRPVLETAKRELTQAEADIERLHSEMLGLESERFAEQDLDHKPDVAAEYEKQLSARRTLLGDAEMRQARWSGDIRAEEAEREIARLHAKETETERKARTSRLIGYLGFVIGAANIIYTLLKH